MLKLTTNSQDCARFLRENWPDDSLEDQEFVCCVYLNERGQRIFFKQICIGRYSDTRIDFATIIKYALTVHSRNIVLAHNHPCGDKNPSAGDKIETKRLETFLEMAQMNLIDHIILTESSYFSFKDAGLLTPPDTLQYAV